MSESFRDDMLKFLKSSYEKPEDYYGYINPHLLVGILKALEDTSEGCVDDKLWDWAKEYWSW